MAFLRINGMEVPTPSRPLSLVASTFVDAARNAKGVLVGQRVGRDIQKIESLQWNYLDAATWSAILRTLEAFYVTVEYPDMVNGGMTSREMYPGDRSAEPYWLDDNGVPTHYINCKVNLIDTGR